VGEGGQIGLQSHAQRDSDKLHSTGPSPLIPGTADPRSHQKDCVMAEMRDLKSSAAGDGMIA
jgi:hypothetical protein